jgi:phosphatidylglycerol lysyltransferase
VICQVANRTRRYHNNVEEAKSEERTGSAVSNVLTRNAAMPPPSSIDAALPPITAPSRRWPARGWGGSFSAASPRSLFFGLAALALAGLVFWGLEKATKGISFHALAAALRETPTSALLLALAATAVSYAVLCGYDLSGLRYARARPPIASVFLASFCSYAIGNAVGFGAFSSGAIRYRVYTSAGLSPGQIARVILFISTALGIVLAAIAGLSVVLCARRVGGMLGASPELLSVAAATLLSFALLFLLFCAARRRPIAIGRIAIEPPGPALVLTQIALTTTDVLAAAAVLWVLLPPVGIGFIPFAGIFAAALGLGVLSHIPGGLGVIEIVIFYAVGGNAPVSATAAALVAYRAVYYLLPLLLSTVLLAGFETRRFLGPAIGERVAAP